MLSVNAVPVGTLKESAPSQGYLSRISSEGKHHVGLECWDGTSFKNGLWGIFKTNLSSQLWVQLWDPVHIQCKGIGVDCVYMFLEENTQALRKDT